jgi:hypothetical protein
VEEIKYLVDANDKKVAVQIDLKKYGEQDILDAIEAEEHNDE